MAINWLNVYHVRSIVVDNIARSQSNYYLAYFYCVRNDAEKERSDPAQLLRSIVRQNVTGQWETSQSRDEHIYQTRRGKIRARTFAA